MKAIVCRNYGSPDVLELEDIDKPIPGDDEVLISVRAASVNALDVYLMRGTPYVLRMMAGLRKPKERRRTHRGRKGDTSHRRELQLE